MTVRWLRNATVSLRAVHAHIALDNPQAAKRVVKAIGAATNHLGEFPSSGRIGSVAGTREVVILPYPYVIVYQIVKNNVEILRVFYTSTDWQPAPH